MLLKIKSEFINHRVGFNGSSKPLGQRDDLDKLAEIAIKSGDKSLLRLFEDHPSEKQIEQSKTEAFLKRTEIILLPSIKTSSDATIEEQGSKE